MPPPSLAVDWREFARQSADLQGLARSLSGLSPGHQKLVAEIVMIRLFLLTENTVASVSRKVLCGAPYLDGTRPSRLVAARSAIDAETIMRTRGRRKAKRFLSWTRATEIQHNMAHALAAADPFFTAVSAHGARLGEMRQVRNHIAHRNERTRMNFRVVIRQHYGGLKRGVTAGLFLLTLAFGPPCMLERYLSYARVFVKDLVRT